MPAAFNFTAPTLAGGTFDGKSLYGKATILWFWAPWCGSCAADSKDILAAIPDLPAGVQILGVPTFSDLASMHTFADGLGVNALTNIVDDKGAISLAFKLPELPSAAVIYPDGYIATIPGSLSTETILQIAKKLAP
jgi:thiol-disulfide isomerase/thioredoxin